MTLKTLSSTLFMFFATFASTVALGVVIKRVTVCPDEDYADCEVGLRFSFHSHSNFSFGFTWPRHRHHHHHHQPTATNQQLNQNK